MKPTTTPVKTSTTTHTPSADRSRNTNTVQWDIQLIAEDFDLSGVTDKRAVYVVPYSVEPAPRFLLATKVNTAHWFSSGYLKDGGIEATWGEKKYFVYPNGLQYQVNKNGGEIVLIGGCEQHKTVIERAYSEFEEETGVNLSLHADTILKKNVFQFQHPQSGTFYTVYLKMEERSLTRLAQLVNKNLVNSLETHYEAALAGTTTMSSEPCVKDNELQSVAIYQAERFHTAIFHFRYGDYFKAAVDHFKSSFLQPKTRPTTTPAAAATAAAPATPTPAASAASTTEANSTTTTTSATNPPVAPEEGDGWTTVVVEKKVKSTKPATNNNTNNNSNNATGAKVTGQENNRWRK